MAARIILMVLAACVTVSLAKNLGWNENHLMKRGKGKVCSGNSFYDKDARRCQECPEGTKATKDTCDCSDSGRYWNHVKRECQYCPGNTITYITLAGTSYICNCRGDTKVFQPKTVTCVNCPPGSHFFEDFAIKKCVCDDPSERYDVDTNRCV